MFIGKNIGKKGFIQLIADIPALLLIVGFVFLLLILLWIIRPNPVVNAETGTLLDSEARANMLLAGFLKSQSNGERVSDIIALYAANRKDDVAKGRLEEESKKLFSFSGKDECYAFELKSGKESIFKSEDKEKCAENVLVTFQTVFTKEAAIPLYDGGIVTAQLAMRMAEPRFKQAAEG